MQTVTELKLARAERIQTYLEEHQGEKFRKFEICRNLKIPMDSITERALKLVRLRVNGTLSDLHFPEPCPGNGYMYTITDHPDDVVDSAIDMGLVEGGLREVKEGNIDFMRDKEHLLTREDGRALIHLDNFSKKVMGDILTRVQEELETMVEARRTG